MTPSYDDLGPRIDIGHEPPGAIPAEPNPAQPHAPYAPPKSGGGMGVFGMIALILSLLALALALWSLMRAPEQAYTPALSPGVVPGATAERTAKLEKDVGDLMLRLVTLEKELEAVRAKAGSVQQLTKLSARVAALQDRLDSMSLDRKISSMKNKGAAPTKTPPAAKRPPARVASKAEPPAVAQKQTPAKKKLSYTVRRGDTLFTVAQRYKVSMRQLKKWNNMKSSSIMIGQKLLIYK
jgi:LysM repeat protein